MGAAAIIGVTLGDAAGIGPEVARAALASGELDPAFGYRLIGSPLTDAEPGKPTPDTARAAWDALEEAAAGALAGGLAAVVTGPVCKAGLYGVGFPFPGQTEFLADRCRTPNSAMLLTGGALTVALVTAHVPLAEVPARLSAAEIARVGALLAEFLQLRLDRRPVRIAVAGLNPHAGENGSIGREEIDLIAPAVRSLQQFWTDRGAHFDGPLPPDTIFQLAVAGRWDGVLCMYHDQGLIPLKLHAFDEGVNVTIGLPIIRTSPDHGTAFDLAGTGRARPRSMIAALKLAAELARKRFSLP